MAPTRLNHIGIAVSSPERLERLFGILGYAVSDRPEVPTEGVRTHFLPLPGGAPALELLEPLPARSASAVPSAIARFVEQRGGGIHHLSFELARGELEPACERLAQAGYRLVYDSPRPGAHHMRINFVHPASSGGVLIELMEPA